MARTGATVRRPGVEIETSVDGDGPTLVIPPSYVMLREAAAVDFVCNAYSHCEVIGHTVGAAKLLVRAGVTEAGNPGVVALGDPGAFVGVAKGGQVWEREAKVCVMA